jgi:glycerol-3-phosphate dehydrogenase (NAD(P)+)
VLITRVVAEASRLCAAVGGEARTFAGLAGLGNLLVRSSPQSAEGSADFQYGIELGRGDRSRARPPEGALAALAGVRLARARGVRVPALDALAAVITGRLSPEAAAAAAGDSVALEE